MRSATGALKEYARDNLFYRQGNKREITGLNTYDWRGQKTSMVIMRFCSKWHHLEEEENAAKGTCTKCDQQS